MFSQFIEGGYVHWQAGLERLVRGDAGHDRVDSVNIAGGAPQWVVPGAAEYVAEQPHVKDCRDGGVAGAFAPVGLPTR